LIAKLPQLETLDGKEVTRSMRILAQQQLPQLQADLFSLASSKRIEKQAKREALGLSPEIVHSDCEDEVDSDNQKMTENTPESRVEIYKELAAQKKEKEDRAKANQPRERNSAKEHCESVEQLRHAEKAIKGRISIISNFLSRIVP
jgi:protein TilB